MAQGGSKKSKEKGAAVDAEYRLAYATDPMQKLSIPGLELSDANGRGAKAKAPNLKPTARLEKKGRGGKSVTVVDRLSADSLFLKALCAALKNKFGTGGTYYEKDGYGVVEIQGEWREEALAFVTTYTET